MNEQKYTPPIFPLVAQVPPAQTNIGSLNECGLPLLNTIKLNGTPPNPELWTRRLEYVGDFKMPITKEAGSVLTTFNVGKVVGSSENDYLSNDCNFIWPRILLLNSSVYFKTQVQFTFWAIKPPSTAGKIRIVYVPAHDDNDKSLSTTVEEGQDDTDMRQYTWEWDLQTKPMFTITINGNNPNNMYPTCSETLIGAVNNQFANFHPFADVPFFNKTYGRINIFVQNQYTPGSIYPDSFTVKIFKHFNNFESSVLVGPRTYAYHTVS